MSAPAEKPALSNMKKMTNSDPRTGPCSQHSHAYSAITRSLLRSRWMKSFRIDSKIEEVTVVKIGLQSQLDAAREQLCSRCPNDRGASKPISNNPPIPYQQNFSNEDAVIFLELIRRGRHNRDSQADGGKVLNTKSTSPFRQERSS